MSQIKLSIPLSDTEYGKFLYFKNVIEAERELPASDLDCLAMLCSQISLYEAAIASIHKDGAIIYAASKYSPQGTPKANPANEVAAKAIVQIKGLLEQLLLTSKAKAILTKTINEKSEDEDDPLTKALLARSNRKL